MRVTLLATLLVFCIIGLGCAQQSPPPAPTPSKTSQDNHRKGSSDPNSADSNYSNTQPAMPPANENIFSPPCCEVAHDSGDNAGKKSATDWVAVLTAILALVALMQWCVIRRQAEYFRRSERTWVVCLPLSFSPELRPKWEPGDPIAPSDELQANVHLFNVTVKNLGKTVAQIDETAVKYVYVEKSLSTLPESPDYGKATPHDGELLIPNGEVWIAVRLTAAVINQLEALQGVESGLLNKRQVAAIQNGQDFLYAYGRVNYRDIFGKRHETRFGYVYHFPTPYELGDGKARFQPAGHRAYNKAD